jgi:hypothetical protein
MTHEVSKSEEAQFLLRKMMFLVASHGTSHPWLWEGDRWKELVFALVTRTSNLSEAATRAVTEQLLHLGLLEVRGLAAIEPVSLGPDVLSARIIDIFHEAGMTGEDALRSFTTIREAAKALTKHHDGKVQLFLRRCAEQMIEEAMHLFNFSELSSNEATYALTYWLQNVANMPVSLKDETVKALASQHGLTVDDIFEAADALDINVALVDDILYEYHGLLRSDEQQQTAHETTPEPANSPVELRVRKKTSAKSVFRKKKR